MYPVINPDVKPDNKFEEMLNDLLKKTEEYVHARTCWEDGCGPNTEDLVKLHENVEQFRLFVLEYHKRTVLVAGGMI
jgi:hypothetical protein